MHLREDIDTETGLKAQESVSPDYDRQSEDEAVAEDEVAFDNQKNRCDSPALHHAKIQLIGFNNCI